MCEFPRDRALKGKGPIPVTQSLLDESVYKPVRKKKMVRHKTLVAGRAYQVFTVIDESADFFIVTDDSYWNDCIPVMRHNVKPLALPKCDWEEVPKRVVWRDVTKQCVYLSFSYGLQVIHNSHPDFEITIKQRVEVRLSDLLLILFIGAWLMLLGFLICKLIP